MNSIGEHDNAYLKYKMVAVSASGQD